MIKKDTLFQIADSQQGYFTTLQAEQCGYARSHFERYLHSGEWTRELRGVYRLVRYPVTARHELVAWSLWSRTKDGRVQGVWSYETALGIYELSDGMPSKMHMTVPKSFRKRVSIPSQLILHYSDLQKHEIQAQQGYFITTPLRTLIDVTEEDSLSRDLLLHAVTDALRRGLVSRKDIENTPSACKIKKIYSRLKF